MKKINADEIKEYVIENGEFEKDHCRGSSFYCSSDLTFTEKHIAELLEEGIDASDFLSVRVLLSGIWDDNYGTEWTDVDYYKVQTVQKLVPEQIIPAHFVTESVESEFKPTW